MTFESVVALLYWLFANKLTKQDVYRTVEENRQVRGETLTGLVGQARRLCLAGPLAACYVRASGGSDEEANLAMLYQLCRDACFFPVSLRFSKRPWEEFVNESICKWAIPLEHPYAREPLPIEESNDSLSDDPWHALWLLIRARESAELANMAYRRFLKNGPGMYMMGKARRNFLLPGIAANLCEGYIAEETLNLTQRMETVRCAAMYAAVRTARPEWNHDYVVSPEVLDIGSERYPVSRGLSLTISSIKGEWFPEVSY